MDPPAEESGEPADKATGETPSAQPAPSVAEAEVPEEAGLTNAADATKTGTTEPPKGASDWTCQECHNVNWARRRECNKCGLPRPKRTKAEDQSLSIGGNDSE
eukprot:EG_transcript_62587